MSWDRVLPSAATVLLAGALTTIAYGRGVIALVAGGAALPSLLAARSLRRRPSTDAEWPDTDWSAAAQSSSPAVEPKRGSVTAALAPVEARELLLSPWFATGIGFCVLFGAIAAGSFERSWWVSAGLMPLLVHPLCGMTIVAVHRNVSRARRDGTDELYEACPTESTRRYGAHLLAGVVPVVIAAVYVLATLVAAGIVLDNIYGPIDRRVVADAVLAGLLLPAGAVALGALLGRRFAFALVPFVAIALVALLNLEFWDDVAAGRGWLASGLTSDGPDLIYYDPPLAGRLFWFLGLAVTVAGLALATGRSSRGAAAATIGIVVAVIGVVVTVRPLSDSTADRLSAYIIDPGRYETCHELATDIKVCALEPYADHGTNLAQRMAPVAAAIPDDVLETPLTLRLLVGEDLDLLPDDVQDRIEPTPIPPGVVALPFGHHDGSLDEARFILAATAVGLPTGDNAPRNVLVDGQARGVVLLWLATAGSGIQDALQMLEPDPYNPSSPSGQGDVWPGDCQADVQWSPQDVTAARAVVVLDRNSVAETVTRDWGRWLDPSTPTDELLVALDLDPVGPHDAIEPLGSTC